LIFGIFIFNLLGTLILYTKNFEINFFIENFKMFVFFSLGLSTVFSPLLLKKSLTDFFSVKRFNEKFLNSKIYKKINFFYTFIWDILFFILTMIEFNKFPEYLSFIILFLFGMIGSELFLLLFLRKNNIPYKKISKNYLEKIDDDEKEKVILITGGNRGIGYYISEALLKKGYKIAVIDIETNIIEKLEINFTHNNLIVKKCDVSSDDEVNEVINYIIKKWGKIDVLVNNACQIVFKNFLEKSIEETKREFDVNYFGYLRLIKHVFPYMKNKGFGIIHNVSSGVGITGFPEIYGYASTKGAIEALTRSLNMEFKEHNVKINVMHPPLTATRSSKSLGISVDMMKNAKYVGYKLADKIFSIENVITPDFRTKLEFYFSLKHPFKIGNLLMLLKKNQKNKRI